jgi:hypothetical protein
LERTRSSRRLLRSPLSGGRACSARCTRRSPARRGSRGLLRRGMLGCGTLRPRLCLWRIIRILDERSRGHVNMAVYVWGTSGTYRVVQGLPEGSLNYGDYSTWLLGGSAVIGTLGAS